MNLSKNITNTRSSPTINIKEMADEMVREGRKVIDLSAGDPDFQTPQPVREAAKKAIEEGFTHYTSASGIQPLKEAVADKYSSGEAEGYNSDQVIISTGGKQSLYNVFKVLLDPGDQVIIPVPYWVSYPSQVRLAGGEPELASLRPEDDFYLTCSDIEQHMTSGVKAILINSPNNPTGRLIEPSELRKIHQLAVRNDTLLIYDECYEELVYDGQHISGKDLPPENLLIVNSLSKTYAMTGWRIGYAIGPKKIIDAMNKLQSHSTSNPCSISQRAALKALTMENSKMEDMVTTLQMRRDYCSEVLSKVSNLRVVPPEGTFYLWLDVRDCADSSAGDDTDFASRLLEEQGVAVVPGSAFGQEGFARLSYTQPRDILEQGLSKIQKFCQK